MLLLYYKSLVKWSAAPKSIGEAVQAVEDAFYHCGIHFFIIYISIPSLLTTLALVSGVPGPVFVELPMDLTWPTKELVAQLPPIPRTFAGLLMSFYFNRYLRRVIQGADRTQPRYINNTINNSHHHHHHHSNSTLFLCHLISLILQHEALYCSKCPFLPFPLSRLLSPRLCQATAPHHRIASHASSE